MIIDYITAILAINSDANVQMEGNSYEGIEWNDTPVISQADLEAKIEELQADFDAKQYARDRATAYPSIGEQLDMIFHAGLGGDEFQAAIQAVKDAHPKPE